MTRRGARQGRVAKPRRAAAHARRPGPNLRHRMRRTLPAPGRIAAGLLAGALIAAVLALNNGPWLRVGRIAWAGERYTTASQLRSVLAALDGTALLTVDASGVAARLARLPAVAEARVEAMVPDSVKVTIVERPAAFVWQTSAVRLLGAADGTLIGQLALQADLPRDLAALPLVDDRRVESHQMIVGDRIDPATLAAAVRLVAVDPAALGSTAIHLALRVTHDDGFVLVSGQPAWLADFGFYPLLDEQDLTALDQRIDAQVAAVRTLFSVQPEGKVSWVDVRDPGRVYWRP
ncbi:MAG: FtsQ-type POTRA domain-containing protein [Chloroflexota bacterium]